MTKNPKRMSDETSNQDGRNRVKTESHLKLYIDYYKTKINPGYGVLITGEWGSGKTYQLKETLTKDEMHYISLFGLQTTEEIYSAVFAKMFPLKSKIKNAASGVGETGIDFGFGSINAGGILSGIANAVIREKVDADKILVFDDLERCNINFKDLLGTFNKYIEHHNCRVIVIAHDSKIEDELKESKEKVFGQTIKVIPQTQDAFQHFTSELKDSEIKRLIINSRNDILGIYDQSETHSLRVLKYTIEDLERLLSSLSNLHLKNNEAISELICFFTALNLEIRCSRMSQKDLSGRALTAIKFRTRSDQDVEKIQHEPNLITASKRYTEIQLDNQILSDSALINTLINGNYISAEIQKCINNSPHFFKATEVKPWLVFMHFDDIDEEQSKKAFDTLQKQFSDRSVINIGEMLHLFAFRYLFADIGLTKMTFDEVEYENIKYMQDLIQEKRFPVPNIGFERNYDFSYETYEGYAFWVKRSYRNHFDRTVDHVKSSQKQVLNNALPHEANKLLELVLNNGMEFAENVTNTRSGDNTFSEVEILHLIPAEKFVEAWLASHPRNWSHISRALNRRYSGGLLSKTLKSEAPWALDVVKLLEDKRSNTEAPLVKERIDRTIPEKLKREAERALNITSSGAVN